METTREMGDVSRDVRTRGAALAALTFSSRIVLILGFGGLLVLLAFAGFDAFQALREIQAANDVIRQDYLSRNRVLEQIRADVYLSGTYVRDYLLEPESGSAETHRSILVRVRGEIDAAMASYGALASPDERTAFEVLARELDAYWSLLGPVLRWDAAERRRRGAAYLQEEVFPRRAAMLSIADRIAALNESQLNAGKLRVARIFARYRRRVLVTAGLTLGLGLVLALLSIGKILRLEREAAARYREIAQARTELKRLSARLVEAQESERRAISRELHDEVGQGLSAVLVDLGNLSTAIRNGQNGSLPERVEGVKRMVENSVAVVRNMALLLRPSMLDDLGLIPALQWQAREVSKRTGLRVQVAAEQVADDLPEEHKTCIYRVVQEALHNCARHAGATHVRVTVRQEAGRILLTVQDDGAGFDSAQVRGLGLLGIEERVMHLGGTFAVNSGDGLGTSLAIALPVAPRREEVLS